MSRIPCVEEGCERLTNVSRGLCWKHAYGGPQPLLPHLPAAPLVALVEARGGCGEPQNSARRRAYHRAKSTGELTVWAADELSHALLGCHPCEVWDSWFGAVENIA